MQLIWLHGQRHYERRLLTMGMPIITPGTSTRKQAVTDLIESVALQETALSHILNAEGEKMQAIIAMPNATTDQLMALNNSVNKMVNSVTRLEMMFQAKLEMFSNATDSSPTDTAAAELAKISVPTVAIPVALDDPTAQAAAVTAAETAAQALIGTGYTATFTPTGYDSTVSPATLTGTFVVTNNTDPADTATGTLQTVSVTSSPISNSAAQFLSGTLLNGDLSQIGGIGGVTAQFITGTTPPPNSVSTNPLDITALGQTVVSANSSTLSLPLSNLLQLGAANQYAEADPNGVSEAYSGAVSNGGIVSIGGSTDFPSSATINLLPLIPANAPISQADISIGAITGAAQWDASLGNTMTPNVDVTAPAQGLGYNLGDATFDIVSPVFGEAVTAIDAAATAINTEVSGLGNTISSSLMNTVINNISMVTGLVPGLNLGTNGLTVSITFDAQSVLTPILSSAVTSPDGAFTVNAGAGSIHIDFGQMLGGTLNNLPANTNLLTPDIIQNNIQPDILNTLSALQTQLDSGLQTALNAVNINIGGGISMTELGLEVASLNVSYNDTLANLLNNTTPITITGTNVLAPFTAGLAPIAALMQTALTAPINTLLNDPETGMLSMANAAISTAITSLEAALSPVFTALSQTVTIVINVQESNVDGANTFTEIPVQISLIGDLATLNLGKVVVGSNTV
jgi:hypothetical protein